MQKLLFRRTRREIRSNFFRYSALFLLIVLSMLIVVGVVASAQSVIVTADRKAEINHLEDGQFGLFVPLSEKEKTKIEQRGVTLEACFYLDFSREDGSTLRVMKNREQINLTDLEKGHPAAADDEIVLERIYAAAHDLSVGDALMIGGKKFTVCGIGTSADYEYCLRNMSDMSSDGKVFGTSFVTPAAYQTLLDGGTAIQAEEYRYSYLIGTQVTDTELKELLLKLHVKPEELQDIVTAADNPRIKAASSDVEINIKVGMMAGVIVLILITYVVSVFVVHSIDRESAMIGSLYAMGLSRKQLMFHYTVTPVLLCFLGGTTGTILGYSGPWIAAMTGASRSYYSTPAVETAVSPLLLAYGILLPPLIAVIVNLLVIRRRLRRSALSLLRKEANRPGTDGITFRTGSFLRTFQLRQLLRERRGCLAVLAGMFVSLLILILGLNCYSLCHNIQRQNLEDAHYEYMYQYKYPTKTPPAGGYAAYIEGLKKEVFGFEMEINLIGLTEDNPFFPQFSSRSMSEISISSSVANKFGLSKGEELVLHDQMGGRIYGFTIKEIVPYSVGLCCFMEIESMRELFGRAEDYYNVLYTDQKLDIDAGRLYAVSTRSDVEKNADIFLEIMRPLIFTLTIAAVFLFLIVLYQMMRVMTDRSAGSISLMKIFGYRDSEIRRLYLDGNFLMIASGSLIMIPAAKWLMDIIYPGFVANVACGIDLSWPPVLYLIVYGGILLCYLLIRTVLMHRLKNISPADVLKDRE